MSWKPDAPQRFLKLALLLAALPPGGAIADRNSEALEALKARIGKLQVEVEETRSERDEVRARLREVDRRIGNLLRNLHDTQARERAELKRLHTLEQARTRNRSELISHRQELEQMVRAAYALGRQEYIKLLLSQEDPARVSRLLTYYHYLGAARVARIDNITRALARLDILEKQIAERQQALAELRADQIKQKQTLENARGERQIALTRLNERLTNRSQEIERLKRDQDRLTRLVRELNTALARTPGPPPAGDVHPVKGRWPLPIKGRLLARYGSPKAVGDLRWRGIFMGTAEGADVRAVTRGRVVYADWLRGFGLLLVLDHGNGLMTLYGHNQSLYKGVGDQVEAGEVIAASGNTGGPPQPGLYFEVRVNGEPRDPLVWCKL